MVLAGRGYSDPETAREFIECSAPLPDPFLFTDMADAVRKISSAIEAGARIVVHGDYDADGITATAVMVSGLRALGGTVDWYLPSRFKEGYGLTRSAIEAIAADGTELLITVDCGVNYPDEVAYASTLGLDVIVVDHHEPGSLVPECCLIHHTHGDYPHGDLCGVGLALKVLHAVHAGRLGADRDRLPEGLTTMLDLVAIGTVADLSPLRGENRYYVREGLRLLNLGQRVGVRALCEVSSCSGAVDSGAVAFRIAPRLNAAGRLSDPSPPLRLLLTEDEAEAKRLAGELHELNGARQDLERQMFDSARRQVESLGSLPTVVVLADSEWHEGVVGIVASRLVEEFRRPTVLLRIRDGVAKGSGRSIPAYDLLDGISQCSELLTVFGGHAQAAGLTLAADNVDAFRDTLEAHASSLLSDADLMPRYNADAIITAEDLGPETARALARLEPFGSGNARPRFLVVDTRLRDLQPTRNGMHVRGKAEVGGVIVPVIGFGMGHDLGEQMKDDVPCVAGVQLRGDEWRGTLRTQLILEEVSGLAGDESGLAVDGTPEEPSTISTAGALSDTSASRTQVQDVQRARGQATWPLSARDRRDRPGRLTELAQILGTQETTVVLVGSRARSVISLKERLPDFLLSGLATACVAGGAVAQGSEVAERPQVEVVEWADLSARVETLGAIAHVIVLDPPYRTVHLDAVSMLADAGALVHLLYGEEQREEMASLLRYIAHPRFAMICVYNAMRSGYLDDERLVSAAASAAWQEARIGLRREDISRAVTILDDLGVRSALDGKAKLDVHSSEKYRQAEADYEECVRSCLTL